MKFRYALLLAPLLAGMLGCSTAEKKQTDKPLIVVTTGMIADAVQQTVGAYAEVEALMGPGVDPHLYKATQGDLVLLRKADIIVYNGLHLEGKMQEVFDALAKQTKVINFSDGIEKAQLLAATNSSQKIYDPHIWFDVKLWSTGVQSLSNKLATYIPAHQEEIKKQGAAYVLSLEELDREVKSMTAALPADSRTLITSHDAFGYYGKAYGFQVVGLQGISTAAEFGLKDVTDMVDLIIEKNIRAVFVESSVSEKSIRSVVNGCQAKGHPVALGGTLFSDAMGLAGTEEGTYIGMVKHNTNTIIHALSKER